MVSVIVADYLPEILVVCQIEAREGDLSEGMDLMESWLSLLIYDEFCASIWLDMTIVVLVKWVQA